MTNEETKLLEAYRKGDLKGVKNMITGTAEKLIEACESGNVRVVKAMLAAGISPNVERNEPMSIATNYNRINIIKILIAHPDIEMNLEYDSFLSKAVMWSRMDILNILLADPRINKEDIRQAIEAAIRNDRRDMLEILLADRRGVSSLKSNDFFWYAIHHDRIEMVKRLLELGVKVTPGNLKAAKEYNRPEILKLLKENM